MEEPFFSSPSNNVVSNQVEQTARNVVAADDDTEMLELYRVILNGAKIFKLTKTFTNGQEIVHYFSQRASTSSNTSQRGTGDVDSCIVILDYNMPVLDGADAARALRKISRNLKIISVSGCDISEEDRKPFDKIVMKPFSSKYFLDALSKVGT
jgi:CheY-like chemotaxis protein